MNSVLSHFNQAVTRAAGLALLIAALARPTFAAPGAPAARLPVLGAQCSAGERQDGLASIELSTEHRAPSAACGAAGAPEAGPPPGAPLTQAPAPNVVPTPVPPPVPLPAPPSLPPDLPVRPLNAEEAAQIALARQPSITAARGAIVAAQGVTQQQRSGLLPSLGVSADYTKVWRLSGQTGSTGTTGSSGTTPGTPTSGQTGTTGSIGTGSGFQASATLRQLIYDFNYTRYLVREARAQERAAMQNLSATQANVVLQVKQAFYQYVQNQRLVTVNEQNLANRQSQLDLANARFRVGLGLPSDVATAQTAVSTAVQNLTVARNSASLAGVNLAQLMGIDPRTPLQPAESGEPPLPSDDVNGFVQTALRQRPEILQAQATIQADQHALSAAKVFNAPALTANLGPNAQGPQFFPQNDTFRIGVSVRFTPFDGGFTSGLVKEARGNLESARAQLSSEQLTVTSDVSQAYLDVRSAEQRVVAAGTEVSNAQEGVRIATGRYRAGLGQFVDILNAQQFLFTALTDQVTAQAALEQARAAFSRAIGSPVAG